MFAHFPSVKRYRRMHPSQGRAGLKFRAAPNLAEEVPLDTPQMNEHNLNPPSTDARLKVSYSSSFISVEKNLPLC